MSLLRAEADQVSHQDVDTNSSSLLSPDDGEIHIRPGSPSDIPFLLAIESASDELFRTIDMAAIPDSPAPEHTHYLDYILANHTWVAIATCKATSPSTTNTLAPVAFIQVDTSSVSSDSDTPSTAFIRQVSVAPSHARRGIGARLVAHVERWAKESGCAALDLTTFEHVPWNRRYYERLGFRVLEERELEMEGYGFVRGVLEDERRDDVLARWERVGMRKEL
jgi:GNAT superfamily N-acetyltransferase